MKVGAGQRTWTVPHTVSSPLHFTPLFSQGTDTPGTVESVIMTHHELCHKVTSSWWQHVGRHHDSWFWDSLQAWLHRCPGMQTWETGLTLHLFTAWTPDPDFSCSPLGRDNLNERDRDLQRQCKRKRRSRTARALWKGGEMSCSCKTVPVSQPCRSGQIQDAEWSHVPD